MVELLNFVKAFGKAKLVCWFYTLYSFAEEGWGEVLRRKGLE